jgi:hypothetical protein
MTVPHQWLILGLRAFTPRILLSFFRSVHLDIDIIFSH